MGTRNETEVLRRPRPGPEAEINRFLDGHRVSHVERQFLADGAASYWAVCVTWIDAETAAAPESTRRGRIDYREVLGADEFALYDRLRTLPVAWMQRSGIRGLWPTTADRIYPPCPRIPLRSIRATMLKHELDTRR